MIWKALRDYGAYVVGRDRPNGGPTETLTVVEAEAAADAIVNPIRGRPFTRSRSSCGRDEQSKDNVGGPGNRLAPLAPTSTAPDHASVALPIEEPSPFH